MVDGLSIGKREKARVVNVEMGFEVFILGLKSDQWRDIFWIAWTARSYQRHRDGHGVTKSDNALKYKVPGIIEC